MKIHFVAVVGSCNEKSLTRTLLNAILNGLLKRNSDYTYEIIFLQEINLCYCCGCDTCFSKGYCTLDKKDNMNIIKDSLKKADCIIFGSPVYAHNISGIMKTFIDRNSSSLHLMDYAGRLGFTITTTQSNGENIVSDYLKKIQTYMGIKNICNLVFLKSFMKEEEFINNSIEDINELLNKNYGFSNVLLEDHYIFIKNLYCDLYKKVKSNDLANNFEINYWQNPDVLECHSFQEFALKNKLKTSLTVNKSGEK